MVVDFVSYQIDTEVPSSYFEKLFDFIYRQYYLVQPRRFWKVSKETSPSSSRISYSVINSQAGEILQVKIEAITAINVTITPLNAQVTEATIEEARQDVVIAVNIFEEKARKATWYFAWREGENIIPEKVKAQEKSFKRILLETQILLSVLFIVLGMGVFIISYTFFPEWFWVAPLALIGFQFLLVIYSNKIISRTGDWTITKDNPVIHFLEYRLPAGVLGAIEDFKQSPQQLVAIKNEVYQEILARNGAIDCAQAQKVFTKYNVSCNPENLTARKINVYEIVKKVADKFGYNVPKIVVSNTLVPNAAASGPSPNRGIVLLTTGLLVQLDEPEIISVLGHEFGHLKGRDPLILYALTSAEFLFRFYILFTFLPIVLGSFLFFVYFWVIMTGIFFVAKFLEARADLISAMIMGQPQVLAEALEKIGFQRLLFERTPSFRFQEWIGLDGHPPIYFRVARLLRLKEPVQVKYPLIQSIKEVFRGFTKAL